MYVFIELSRLLRAFFCSQRMAVVCTIGAAGTRVPAPEGAKVSERPQACLLNTSSASSRPHEPAREVVPRVEMRKDSLVKKLPICGSAKSSLCSG